MKKWKKRVVLFAALVLAIFIAPQWRIAVSAANGDIANGTSNNITWVIDANGKLTISGSGDFLRLGEYRDRAPWYDYRENIKSAVVNVTGMTDASHMFDFCENLTSVDLSHFDTSNVTDMSSMFNGCKRLISLDVSGFDTSKVTTMYMMFTSCASLNSLDLSHFNTSKVTDMCDMFWFCSNLTNLDLSSFNTSNVENMFGMFCSCTKLETLNISSFNTSKVKNMQNMFAICFNLKNLKVDNFDTSNVTNMNCMFYECWSLTDIDVSNFNTSNVKNIAGMFRDTKFKELDLRNFDLSNVMHMYALNMFDLCDNLSTIYTPYNNNNTPVPLYGTGWHLSDGTELTELPQGLDHSITVTRTLSDTIKDDQNNGNNSEEPDVPNVDDNDQHWNNGTNSGQTGANSGVLEGTGSSADSAVYGKRLLTAKPTDFKTILLSWEAVPGAKSYEIFYSTSPTGGFKRLANVKKTSYKFSKAKCGVTYYFQMRVCEKKVKSEFGPVSYAKTDLTGATTLQVKKTTYNSVQLKWSKVPGAKKYEIFYSDSIDGNWQSLGVKGGTSFTHKKLVTGATYYYQVRPVRDSFCGSWSNGVSATTTLGDVAGLKVKAAGSDQMKLSWKKVNGATQYVILRSESIDGTYETIGRSGRTSYMDTGLPGGTTYFYKVYAVSGPYKTKETAPVGQTTRISK